MKVMLWSCTSTVLLLFFSSFGLSQNKEADSLRAALSHSSADTSRVMILMALAWKFSFSKPDTAIQYGQEGLALAEQLQYENGMIQMSFPICEAMITKGDFSQAFGTITRAAQLAQKSGDLHNINESFIHLADVYTGAGDYRSALKNYFEALDYYYRAESERKGEIFFFDSLKLYSFIGQNYFSLHLYDSANIYLQKSYDLSVRKNERWPVPYFFMGKLSALKKDYREALLFYRKGLDYSIETLDFFDGYLYTAEAYDSIGMVDSSRYYAYKTFTGAKGPSVIPEYIRACALLSKIYSDQNRFDSAFKYRHIQLAVTDSMFNSSKLNQMQALTSNEKMKQQELLTERDQLGNKIKMYVLLTALLAFLLIALLQFRNILNRKKAYGLLQNQKRETDLQKSKADQALGELKATQTQLIQSEKMASLGELTAGIAHEIQNPLNFVNNFSEVNTDLIGELQTELESGNTNDAILIAGNIRENEQKINQHGKRADAIIKGMLLHSRNSAGMKEPSDINALADEYLRISYQGLRARDKSFNATLQTDFDSNIGKINIQPQEIGRVLLNLYNNAFYAVAEKKKAMPESFEPIVLVTSKKIANKIEISVKDNGNGIPQKLLDKIFQPFFTTKPAGQGTGLGLSLSYDIVKAHGGEIKVLTRDGEYSEFIILLPA